MTTTRYLGRCAAAVLTLLGLPALDADAAVLTVGAAGSGCNHLSIQAAINAAEANPGPDTILITRSAAWTQQALVINTDQTLELIGGYATCTSSPDGTTP